MHGRIELLRRMWQKEHHTMVMTLAKNKTKSKKQKDFLAKVRGIPDTVKEAILAMYLEKCKQQNAIEFFDWHRKVYGSKDKPRDAGQSFVISLRLSRIKRHEHNLF